MATIAGLNTKFSEGLDAKIGAAALGLSDAQKEGLKAVLQSEEAKLAPLVERDQDRTEVITHLQTKMLADPRQADQLKTAFEVRHKSLIENLKKIHEEQFEAFERKLETLGVVPPAQATLLMDLRKAQQDRIDALEARAKIDAKCLENPIADRNMQISAAMILRNLNIGVERDDKGEPKAPAGPLVERWRAPLWPTIKKGIMGIEKFGIGKKFIDATGEDPDLFDMPGEVEAKFVKNKKGKSSLLNLRKDRNNTWGYQNVEGETFAIANPLHRGESDWNLSPVKDYFDQGSHTYSDVGAAGAFPRKLQMKPFGSVGEFTISAGQIFANKDKHLPGADSGLICRCEGGVSPDQKIVRIGIMAHEAMARGWSGVDLSVMPEQWRQEAYLACRRAGFTHDQITITGGMIPDKWRNEGDVQRNRIEGAMKENVSDTVMTKLALQLQSPDMNIRPERFFDTTRVANPNDRIQLFGDETVNATQRAAIVADPAFDMAEIQACVRSITSVPEQAAFVDALNKVHPQRAVSAFDEVFQQMTTDASKIAFFKALSSDVQVSIVKFGPFTDQQQQTLLKELTVDQKIALLKQPNLSSKEAFDVLRSGSDLEKQSEILSSLAKVLPQTRPALVRILVGIAMPATVPAAPAGAIRGPAGAVSALELLYKKIPVHERDNFFSAFINDGALSSQNRDDILGAIDATAGTKLDSAALLRAMNPENQIHYFRNKAVPITDDSLKRQGITDPQRRRDLLNLDNLLNGNPAPAAAGAIPMALLLTNANRQAFINVHFTSNPRARLCAGIIRDLTIADQGAVLLGIQPHIAAKLLEGIPGAVPGLSDAAMVAVRAQIGVNAAAGQIFYNLTAEKAAEGLLFPGNANISAPLGALAQNANTALEKNSLFAMCKELGATVVGSALVGMNANQRKALLNGVAAKVADPAATAPEKAEAAKFLAQALGFLHSGLAMAANDPVYQFSNDNAAVILAQVNDLTLMQAIIKAAKPGVPAGQPAQARVAADFAQILVNIPDNAQKAKVFSRLTAQQQTAVFAEGAFTLAYQQAVFHRMDGVERNNHMNTVAQSLQGGQPAQRTAAANQLVTLLSDPGFSKTDRAALWTSLTVQQQTDILSNVSSPSAAFFIMVLEGAGAQRATVFNQILNGAFVPVVASAYLDKVAHALAASTLSTSELSGLFVAGLTNRVTNAAGEAAGVHELRVSILTQFVMRGRPAEAKALFDALPAGAEKDQLKEAVKTAAPQSPFKAGLYQAVGYVPPAPALPPRSPAGP